MTIQDKIHRVTKNKNFLNGIIYTLFSFFNNGVSFILLLILATYLIPADYGYLNLFTTFVTLLNLTISLCTTSYVTISFFQKDKKSLHQVILIALATTTGMLLLFSLFMLFLPTLVESSIGVPIKYLWLGLFISYFQVYNTLNLDIWRLEEKPISYGLYGMSFALCNFILSLWLIFKMNNGWEGRAYAWILTATIYFIISIVFLIKRDYLKVSVPSIRLIKETFIYSLPLLPHTISFWIKSGMDKYLINYFHGQAVVGYFSFAANLAAIITIIGTAFNATNSVYIYKNLNKGFLKVKNTLNKQNKIMTLLFLVISVVVMVSSWMVISFLLTKYQDSIRFIFPLCVGGLFQCGYLLWVNYLFFYKYTKTLMIVTFSTSVVQLILSIIFTRISALFTAYISMVINIITTYVIYKISTRIIKEKIISEYNNHE